MYRLRNPWLRAAILLLQIVATVVVVTGLLDGLSLSVNFGDSEAATYKSSLSGGMLGRAALAALVLLLGVILGRAFPPMMHDTRFGAHGPGVGALTRTVGAALAITVVLLAFHDIDRSLHPSFDGQRAAVAAFPLPPGASPADIDTEVGETLRTDARFTVPGTQDDVCPALVERLTSWARGGSVTTPDVGSNRYDRVVRRGPDTVSVMCWSSPRAATTYVTLRLTRAH